VRRGPAGKAGRRGAPCARLQTQAGHPLERVFQSGARCPPPLRGGRRSARSV